MYQLTIQCGKQPDVLERVLRVIRHRGFSLDSLGMRKSSHPQQMELTIDVSGIRPLGLLTTQLEKLYDVILLEEVEASINIHSQGL
ncbi:MAG: acetolactate synthase 2 small subunit [Endozoicomonas sp.]